MKNKEKIIGSIVILFVIVIFLIVGYVMSRPKESVNVTDYEDMFVETAKKPETKAAAGIEAETKKNNVVSLEESNIKVDIKGAVKAPGVYEIQKGSRVTDLIKLAGGGTSDADLDATNLSAKLNDEDCIVIARKGVEGIPQTIQNKPGGGATLGSKTSAKDSIININTASKEELMTLTGIGEAKAGVIIEYREQNGGFKTVDELTKVGGIGEKTLSKFIDKIDIK